MLRLTFFKSLFTKKITLYTLIFIVIFLASFLLRLLPVLNNNFPFTMDQGRDMLDIRNIVVGKHLTLIGPTTSINGLFLGPFWYYFNVPPFIISRGDPAFLVYWLIIWYQLTAFAIWVILKKSGPLLALLTSVLFLTAPAFFYISRFSWSANPAPLSTIFFFLTLFSILQQPSMKKSLFLGIISGITLQIEAAFGFLLFPFALLALLFKRVKLNILFFTGCGFFLTLLPQIVFELRHGFMMTQTFFKELGGQTTILGEKLNLTQTLVSHFLSYTYMTHGLLELPNIISQYLFLGIILFLLILLKLHQLERTEKNLFLVSFFFLIFSFLVYQIYPYHLKGWYLNGLFIPLLFILAVFIKKIISWKGRFISFSAIIVLILIFANTFNIQSKFVFQNLNDRSGDRSNLRNELEAIDWVYQKSAGQGFKVFNYIPSVYDFPYQYLFWWYGNYKYGYQPTVTSYLENVPEYIPNNNQYQTNIKTLIDNSPVFLIMEKEHDHPDRFYAWRGNFSHLCLIEKIRFNWETEVEKLTACPTK